MELNNTPTLYAKGILAVGQMETKHVTCKWQWYMIMAKGVG